MARRLEGVHAEAMDVRSRLYMNRWDVMPVAVASRLRTLRDVLTTGPEMHRHVVVAAIAALESSHRATIISIVEAGPEYRQRAAESITEKIAMKDALAWFAGATVTFGELVAHVAPCSSVGDMLSWLSTLLGVDAKKALAQAANPHAVRNGTQDTEPIVRDIDKLLAALAEAFRLRHILAHEVSVDLEVSEQAGRDALGAVSTWVQAVDAVLWVTAFADLPLNQHEMNQHARNGLMEARRALARALKSARKLAIREGTSAWLRANQTAWIKATTDWSLCTYGSLQGTMWPSVGASDLTDMLRARAVQVHQWVRWQSADSDPGPLTE